MAREFTDDFKRSAVAAVLAGESVTAVGKRLGVNNSVIYGWKKKLDPSAPPSEAKSRGRPPAGGKATAEQKAEAVRRLDSGENINLIAEAYGVSSASVYLWRKSERNGGKNPYLQKPAKTASVTPAGKPNGKSNGTGAHTPVAVTAHLVASSPQKLLVNLQADPRVHDSLIWLKQMTDEIKRQWMSGKIKEPSRDQLLAMLARSELMRT